MKTIRIEIQQLDAAGNAYRTFTYHSASSDPDAITEYTDRIARAYNMEHTRILVDGKVWA